MIRQIACCLAALVVAADMLTGGSFLRLANHTERHETKIQLEADRNQPALDQVPAQSSCECSLCECDVCRCATARDNAKAPAERAQQNAETQEPEKITVEGAKLAVLVTDDCVHCRAVESDAAELEGVVVLNLDRPDELAQAVKLFGRRPESFPAYATVRDGKGVHNWLIGRVSREKLIQMRDLEPMQSAMRSAPQQQYQPMRSAPQQQYQPVRQFFQSQPMRACRSCR